MGRRRRPRAALRFRVIALTMLVGGALGGVYLGLHGQEEQRTRAEEAALSVEDGLAGLDPAKLYAAEARTDAAVQAAQAKAAVAAAAAAQTAARAEELARKSQPASRSENRAVPASCQVYSGNRAIGCALLLDWGWRLDQMPCLDQLWERESRWRTTAGNRTTGAYGIPQALPGSKMAAFGSDWQTNPVPQIKWGLDYIERRYGSPCTAWSSFQSKGWY